MANFNPETTYDLCIVGSGPAGIIVALEYSRNNPDKNVLLVEYGDEPGSVRNKLDDSIEIKNKINHHDPYECTNKGLGGTSATWGGRCVMFDEVDFVDRPIVANGCTWNIALLNELQPYLKKSALYFECGDPVFNLNQLPKFRDQRIAENFVEGIVTDSVIERWSMPTRFGDRYKKDIAEQANLTFMPGFEARDFSEPNDDDSIQSLVIREVTSGRQQQVQSRFYVLAAGTQETTRILLRNKHVFKNIGKVPSALGKYYQGHLSGKIASVHFSGDPKKTDYGFLRDDEGIYVRRRFQFSTNFLIEKNLLNTAIWLDNPLYYDPRHRSGSMSLMYLAMITPILGKKLAPPAIAHSITKGTVTRIHQHVLNILLGLPTSLITPTVIFYKRYLLNRKLPGVFLYSPKNQYSLHFHSEQVPSALNRMELGADGESLVIHYSLSDEDIQSVIQLHEVLDEHLQKTGCGKLDYWFPRQDLPDQIRKISRDGIHQSGTTRIGDSPERGVVDANLKVFGTKNLFICSSSVFPTSSQANPTFLIGAFSVRLADYLKQVR